MFHRFIPLHGATRRDHQRRRPISRALPAVATLLLAASGAAHAQAPDKNLGRNLAATCANCHGTGGKATGAMPALAGLPAARLVATMAEFRSGKRPATIMHQISKGYTDAQIAAIAAFFEQQKM